MDRFGIVLTKDKEAAIGAAIDADLEGITRGAGSMAT